MPVPRSKFSGGCAHSVSRCTIQAMSGRTHLTLSPLLLRWARESSGLSPELAARRLGIKREKLDRWELDHATPTPRQLEKAADVYKRPVASFFLSEPPKEPPLPVDFRSMPGEQAEFSPKTLIAIRRARWLESIYREISDLEGEVALPNVRKAAPEALANAIREFLGVAVDEVRGMQPSAALTTWRSTLEAKRILLFQFSIPIEEARAFSLLERFPMIVLNSKDSYAARVFSTFHELAHLFLRQPGLCIPEIGRPRPTAQDVERLCNTAAGLALVPTNELLSRREVRTMRGESSLPEVLEPLARYFAVSRQVILRRLVDVNLVSWAAFARMMEVLRAEFEALQEKRGKRQIIVPPSVKIVSQLGRRVVADALAARSRGVLTEADLSEFLGLKLQHVPDVEAIVEAR